ncbi:DNA polymerase delta subunit 3 [Bulinus truncatus]|nr:DNA polymerase delta subunit 3 [Bulinus truncatus]
MATDLDETLIQENIEEYVNDDNKIVTIRWLSLTLNIHINEAKRALTKFVTEHRGKKSDGDFNATYFIAGLGKSKSGDPMHKCIVVPDIHLEEVKKSFSIITSCHIYSVQKTRLKDYTSLYMTDFDIIREHVDRSQSFSSIKCPWVEKKPKVEYIKSYARSSDDKPAAVPPASTSVPAAKANAKKSEPKGSIATMFASTGKKNVSEEKSAPVKEEVVVNPPNKASRPEAKKGSVLAMFNKQTNNRDDVKKTEVKNNSTSKESVTVTSNKTGDTNGGKVSNKRSLKSEKYEPKKKQRRRIKTDLFDSSDEDNNESEKESEDEVDVVENLPVSDDEIIDNSVENIKEVHEVSSEKDTPAEEDDNGSAIISENKVVTVGPRGEKRKRTKKVVTKTFVDEEGFIVTSKEKEWESETDDSESENSKTEEKKTDVAAPPQLKSSAAIKTEPKSKEVPKKNISPRKGKQTSLMSFFKKS